MSAKNPDPDLMKIGEAASYLGVARRTIYRWIWGGLLPASKIGGLYFIHRKDLEGKLSQSRAARESETQATDTVDQMKCGLCRRLIRATSQVGATCLADDCEAVLCVTCAAEGHTYCSFHTPSTKEQFSQAEAKFARGELQVLLRGNYARLRETTFLHRLRTRLAEVNTLVHPVSGDVLTISDWETHATQGDERAKVMQILHRVILDTEITARSPLNPWMAYRLPAQRGKDDGLVIHVQVLSHLPEMLKDGYDTRPFSENELVDLLNHYSEKAEQERTVTLLVLAATTGWQSSAKRVIIGDEAGTAFVHRWLLVYLFDMESGQLVYNEDDERLRGYAEIFSPILHNEEVEEVIRAVEKELVVYESLTLEYATEVLSYPKESIHEAFKRMKQTGKYMLVDIPKTGLAIVRK
jgi:excisionase family DNA binding protein